MVSAQANIIRDESQIRALFELPFNDLLLKAQTITRQHFRANTVQASTLLSIKTGGCPEDCGYCSQSGHHDTAVAKQKKLAVDQVLAKAKNAKAQGATRFCMGAAWRNPHKKDMPYVLDLVREVKALGLETCMTLGMLSQDQAQALHEAGLDYYNHNIDTSREYYPEIISTRTFEDRLQTLEAVRDSGMKVCSGGIIGMGERRIDRIRMLVELASLPKPPESVPINLLVPIKGTPLGDAIATDNNTKPLPVIEWVRTIAVARICLPASYIRLSAGRESLTDAEQALAFMAGANSFFYGDTLLTSNNKLTNEDDLLLETLGIKIECTNRSTRIPMTEVSR